MSRQSRCGSLISLLCVTCLHVAGAGASRANAGAQECKINTETSAFELRQPGSEITVSFTPRCRVVNVFPDVPWLRVISVDEPAGTMKFRAAPNPDPGPRSTRVYISFSADNSPSVGVKQSGTEKIYFAACNRSHPNSWFGPDRELESEAKRDADEHNRNNQGHNAGALRRQ